MRSLVPLLLLALQCLDGVWALRCHSCTANAETCTGPTECAADMKACLNLKQTAVIQSQTVTRETQVVKSCVQNCEYLSQAPESQKQFFGIVELRTHTFCCSTDLCNAAPGRGLGAATVGMMLLAPVLATLLGDFL